LNTFIYPAMPLLPLLGCSRTLFLSLESFDPDLRIDERVHRVYPSTRMNGLSAPSTSSSQGVFDRLSVLADPVRCRLLTILERDELTVSELCSILQLPQSTASRHLKTLVEDGWVQGRKDGTSRRYIAQPLAEGSSAAALWSVVHGEIAQSVAVHNDLQRLQRVLAERRTKSQEFFSSAAAEWTEVRKNLFGEHFDRIALLGLLDRSWTVADLGTGSGQMSAHLAPFVGRVIAVDESDAMLQTARKRLLAHENVEVRQGRLESLPIADGELDAATLVLVLHYLPDPQAAIAEAARALCPGGRLLLVDMLPHERAEYRQSMGHLWLGFSSAQLEAWFSAAGFEKPIVSPLPIDATAKGPTLFAASAVKAPR